MGQAYKGIQRSQLCVLENMHLTNVTFLVIWFLATDWPLSVTNGYVPRKLMSVT